MELIKSKQAAESKQTHVRRPPTRAASEAAARARREIRNFILVFFGRRSEFKFRLQSPRKSGRFYKRILFVVHLEPQFTSS